MSKMRSFRKSSSFYNTSNIVSLPKNEFELFLKEHPELISSGKKYNWDIGQRYIEQQPTTKNEFEKLFAESVEYVQLDYGNMVFIANC